MSAHTNLHLTDAAAMSCQVIEHTEYEREPFRTINVHDGDGNQITLFLTDDQARELAETILAALYPEMAALAEAHAEVRQ